MAQQEAQLIELKERLADVKKDIKRYQNENTKALYQIRCLQRKMKRNDEKIQNLKREKGQYKLAIEQLLTS